MKFRIPPPEYGWTTLVWEFVIVFAGILAALIAENWATDLSDKRKAVQAGEAIGAEIAVTSVVMQERLAIRECLKQRLSLIDGAITKGGELPEPLPDLYGSKPIRPVIYRAPSRPLADDAWQSALATGAVSHMQQDQLTLLASLNNLRALWLDYQSREQLLFNELSQLNSGIPLSNEMRGQLLVTVAELDSINNIMVVISGQYVTLARQLDIDLSGQEIAAQRAELIDQNRQLRGDCVKDPTLG